MTRRVLIVSFCVVAIAYSLSADFPPRGDVYFGLETSYNVGGVWKTFYDLNWLVPVVGGFRTVRLGGCILIVKCVPFDRPGLFVPRPDLYLFNENGTVSWWNTQYVYASSPEPGYIDIFHDDVPLGDIAPWPTGNFVVPELTNDPSYTPKLIEFNLQGRVREYEFPSGSKGALHVDLLADRCTLLYTTGDDPFVHRMNVCTGEPLSDFVTLLPSQKAGAVRQLANGAVVVATTESVAYFTSSGEFVLRFPLPGATALALSTDGRSFWAGSVDPQHVAHLVHFDPEGAGIVFEIKIESVDQRYAIPVNARDIVVVGEWRAASQNLKRRAVARP